MSKSSIVAELLYILVAYDRGSRRYNCDAQEVVERGCGEEREEKKNVARLKWKTVDGMSVCLVCSKNGSQV